MKCSKNEGELEDSGGREKYKREGGITERGKQRWKKEVEETK
jgi:hypothetical protein